MNSFFAIALGGVILFLVGGSLFKLYNFAQTELGARDRRVALAIVIAIIVVFVAVVFVLQARRA